MANLAIFSYREADTIIHRRHPYVKLIGIICITLLLSTGSWPRVTLLTLLLISIGIALSFSFTYYAKKSLFFILMATIIAIAHYRQQSDIIDAFTAAIRFLDYVLAGLLFADSTAPDDLARSLSPVCGSRLSATIEITMRTIGVFFETAQRLRQARIARLEHRFKHPLRRIVSFASSMIGALLYQGELFSHALIARQFNPDAKRESLVFKRSDGMALIVILLLSISMAILIN
ncbi:MAG: energy-coupling factor transporter transmembrane component T [Sphaerochaetaceae bacterium]|jgi:biotin transport system permease protein|nr:energy-coupling factor transporter transmembrane protein EcfT [Sphaerochaetaceae bacterium]NLO61232.1 hypothetical protein [Spirochaetales bacterium]MDD2405846.1 energy-coupling factor transporter transmembrane component T [Sphaerochaetaceae bacterium]MDD4260361.1 energy-coupling factor transporter transmembrane component T [Sphaerochaetaceae bacterium]MDD4762984.1 energy-coupling factor transporter transmembrane component T [Sphaerochaetaceae bacterium]